MLHRLSILSLGFALAISPVALAQVSVWTDENGQRHYVDSPSTPAAASDRGRHPGLCRLGRLVTGATTVE